MLLEANGTPDQSQVEFRPSGIFDTPDACVERLRWVQEELGPGRVICWFHFGGLVPHDRVLRSMELFSARVMPHF